MKEPTHRDGHILDLIITRALYSHNAIHDVTVLPACVSDHHATTARITMARPSQKPRLIATRRMKAIDRIHFVGDLHVQLAALGIVQLIDAKTRNIIERPLLLPLPHSVTSV